MTTETDMLIPVPHGKSVCTMCGKLYDKPLIVCRDSDLCPDCMMKYRDMAFIYCSQCHVVVSRINPGPCADGTVVAPGDILVVDKCPQCAKGTVKSEILKVVHNGSGERLP